MFDTILNAVKEQIGGQLKSQTGLNDEQVSQSVDVVGESTQEVVKEEASGGNIEGLMQAFSGGNAGAGNPVIDKLGSNIVGNLVSRLGFSEGLARQIKTIALPFLIKTISSKFSGAGGGDAAGLLGMFQGAGNDSGLDALKAKAAGQLKDKLGGLGKLF